MSSEIMSETQAETLQIAPETKIVITINNAQKVIDKLCEDNDVPKIPVKYVDHFEDKQAGAMFDGKKYVIEFSDLVDANALIHEFLHYIVKLLSLNLEENMVKRATDGYIWELERENQTKLSKLMSKFTESQKELMKK